MPDKVNTRVTVRLDRSLAIKLQDKGNLSQYIRQLIRKDLKEQE